MLALMKFLRNLGSILSPVYDETRGLTPAMVADFAPARALLSDLINASEGMRPVRNDLAYYRFQIEAPISRFTYHVGHSGYPDLIKPWLAYAEEIDTLPGLPMAELSGRQLSMRQERFATPVEAVVGFAKLLQADLTQVGRNTDLMRTSRIKVSLPQLAHLASLADAPELLP
jgi:hypothetical protein